MSGSGSIVAASRGGGRIAGLHPGWFGVVLGTGGAALAGLIDPIPGTLVDLAVGAVLLVVAAVLLVVLAVPYALRVVRHRESVLADLANPGLGALFGSIPGAVLVVAIALAQAGVVGLLPPGVSWVVALLLAVGVGGAFLVGVEFFARLVGAEQMPLQAVTGAWFIPIVVFVLVPSAVSRLVQLDPGWGDRGIVAVAIALWGAGTLLFLVLAPIVAHRLVALPGPNAQQAASWWIWLAPAGAGGLGTIATARLAGRVLPGQAESLLAAGLLGATVFWGFGLWWTVFAVRVLAATARANKGLPFHVGSWGFVFPSAAITALSIELGRSWNSPVLQWSAAAGWVVMLALWLRMAWQTLTGIRKGTVFER